MKSAKLRKTLLRFSSTALAFILIWMNCIATLNHTDACDNCIKHTIGSIHCDAVGPMSAADHCVACAWSAEANIYLPGLVTPPAGTHFIFESLRLAAEKQIRTPNDTSTTRGPPTVA